MRKRFHVTYDIEQAYARDYDAEQAGRDLWFTSQGHGVGFWDREALKPDSDEYEALTRDMIAAGANSPAWSAALAKRNALEAESIGQRLTALARDQEWHVWFGNHVAYGDAPFVHAQRC